MDQDLQDLKKLNLVELEEKLHEINNNNRVSFNEYESESIDSPIEKNKKIRKSRSKKIDLSDEEQETKIEKPKRERTQKQIEAFEKARARMMENAELRKQQKQIENEIKKKGIRGRISEESNNY